MKKNNAAINTICGISGTVYALLPCCAVVYPFTSPAFISAVIAVMLSLAFNAALLSLPQKLPQ